MDAVAREAALEETFNEALQCPPLHQALRMYYQKLAMKHQLATSDFVRMRCGSLVVGSACSGFVLHLVLRGLVIGC